MCSHITKRVRTISSCFYFSPQYQNLQHLAPLLRSFISTQTPAQPQKELPFIAQYLISSFGFSSTRALKVSAYNNLAAIKSPARPEAVVKFLSDTGLTDAQIKAVVTFEPNLLMGNVDKTFKPKVSELMNWGCSQKLLVQLIRYNPNALYLKDTISRLRFWRDFVGNDDQALLKLIERSSLLMTYSIDKHILPRINLLKEYGMSNQDVSILLQQGSRCMSNNLDSLRRSLELIEELGVLRGSKKYRSFLKAVGGISEDTLKRKVEFFKKTYGWSQKDVNSAFTKFPNLLSLSENKVKSNMGFLLGKARFEPRSMASSPRLIGSSLDRVLIPRYTVLCALQAKGLKKKCSFLSACVCSEEKFLERYVVPYEKDLPGLGEVYAAAFGGNLRKQRVLASRVENC